jgi:cell filamentation protein
LAKSAGWHLDWAQLGKTEQDRVQLYWARDKAVTALALPHVQSEATMKRLIRAQHAIPDSPKLHDLIGSVLRPTRALMFETRPESVALREHPELIHAYNMVRAAGTFFNSKFPSNPLDVDAGVRAVVAHVQNRLNAGEVKDFGRGRYTHLVDVPQEITALKAADRGTER